jgi:hypothetical protein
MIKLGRDEARLLRRQRRAVRNSSGVLAALARLVTTCPACGRPPVPEIEVEIGFGPELAFRLGRHVRAARRLAARHGYGIVNLQRGWLGDLERRDVVLDWQDGPRWGRVAVLQLMKRQGADGPAQDRPEARISEHRRLWEWGAASDGDCQCGTAISRIPGLPPENP